MWTPAQKTAGHKRSAPHPDEEEQISDTSNAMQKQEQEQQPHPTKRRRVVVKPMADAEKMPALQADAVAAAANMQPAVAAAPNESLFSPAANTEAATTATTTATLPPRPAAGEPFTTPRKPAAVQSSIHQQQIPTSRSARALEEPSSSSDVQVVCPPTPSSVVAGSSGRRRPPPFVRLSEIPVEQRLSSPLFGQLSAYRITHKKQASKVEVVAMQELMEGLGPGQYGLVCSNLLLENDNHEIRMWQVNVDPSDNSTIMQYVHRRLLFEDDFDLQADKITEIYRQEQNKKTTPGLKKPTPLEICLKSFRQEYCVLGLTDSERLQRLQDEVWKPLADADNGAIASAPLTLGKQEQQLVDQKEQIANMWALQKKQQELQSEQNQIDLAKEQNLRRVLAAMGAANSGSGTTPQALFAPVNGATGQDGQQGGTSGNDNNDHQYNNNNSTTTLQHVAAGSAGGVPGSADLGQLQHPPSPLSTGSNFSAGTFHTSVFDATSTTNNNNSTTTWQHGAAGSADRGQLQPPRFPFSTGSNISAGGAHASVFGTTSSNNNNCHQYDNNNNSTTALQHGAAGSARSVPGSAGLGQSTMTTGSISFGTLPPTSAAPAAAADSGGAIGPSGFTFPAAALTLASGPGPGGFASGGAATNNGAPAAAAPMGPASGGGYTFFGGSTPASATQQQSDEDESMAEAGASL